MCVCVCNYTLIMPLSMHACIHNCIYIPTFIHIHIRTYIYIYTYTNSADETLNIYHATHQMINIFRHSHRRYKYDSSERGTCTHRVKSNLNIDDAIHELVNIYRRFGISLVMTYMARHMHTHIHTRTHTVSTKM